MLEGLVHLRSIARSGGAPPPPCAKDAVYSERLRKQQPKWGGPPPRSREDFGWVVSGLEQSVLQYFRVPERPILEDSRWSGSGITLAIADN